MKSPLKSALPAFSVSLALISTAAAFGFWKPEPLDDKATDAAVTILTSKILEQSQFSHQQLDDKLAHRFLDRYLDTMDGGHMLFLKSDVDEFSRNQPSLAASIRDRGDTSLAQVVFKRYLERLEQRVAFTTRMLKDEKFEFTSNETFSYDRKSAPRPANLEAAQDLWRQQLRYDYLQEKLGGKNETDIVKTLSRRAMRVRDTMRKLDAKAVLEMYLEALAQTYDPHSDYMGAEQLKTFEIGMNLSLIGIGASLRTIDGYCKVEELVPGGPAARSGLIKVGDRIVGVSQKEGGEFTDLVDLPISQAVELIRGKKGTPVYLNVIPASAADESVRKTITIVREEVKLEDQQAKAQIIDLPVGDRSQRVGVIDLPGFYAGEGAKGTPTSATADVAKLLAKLKRENITGLILDLRRNGGGSLKEAIDLTGLFISSGPVVQTRNPEGDLEIGKDRDSKVAYDGPLVVLISRFSASASEILAGALQDYGRAVVVGDSTTFGKGTVQTLVPLSKVMENQNVVPGSDPGALKVTISKFYRPSGKSTQLEGVKADLVIPSITDMPEISEGDLGNALPCDTIAAARFTALNRVSPSLAELRGRSQARVSKDPDFTELKSEIERFRKMRADKTVSLNEEKRRKEMDDLKAHAEAVKKDRLARASTTPPAYEVTLKNLGNPGLGDPVKPKAPTAKPDDDSNADLDSVDVTHADDVILREAEKILVDYSGLLKGEPNLSER